MSNLRLVPPVLVLFLKSGLVEKYDLSHIKEIITGGASLGPEVEEELYNQLGKHTSIKQGHVIFKM